MRRYVFSRCSSFLHHKPVLGTCLADVIFMNTTPSVFMEKLSIGHCDKKESVISPCDKKKTPYLDCHKSS